MIKTVNIQVQTKWSLLLIIFLIIVNNTQAQPVKYPLEDTFYISITDLNVLLNKLKTAPIVNERCLEANCDKINKYYNALHNLREDIKKYALALEFSKDISKNQWLQYFNDTYNNEDLKAQLTNNLAVRELLTNISSASLDVASLSNALQTGQGIQSKATLTQLTAAVAALDGMLSSLNLMMKVLTNDAGTTAIGSMSSDDWNNIYSGLRGVFELFTEGLALYKKVDDVITPLENVAKLKKLRKANLVAAFVQFVNMYVSYQNGKMKAHIAELDKVLAPNQNTQSLHYDKFILKRKLLDMVESIRIEIDLKYYGLQELNLKCNGASKRGSRKDMKISEREYGLALQYYKGILVDTNNGIENAWSGIEDCFENTKKYQFAITDGLGKKLSAYIEVIRELDGKILYNGSISSKTFSLALYPDVYAIEIYEGQNNDGIRNARTIITNYKIDNTTSDSIIKLNPFGRVHLDVVDKNGDPIEFRYRFLTNNIGVASSITARNEKVVTDLPTNIALDLELIYGFKSETKKSISISSGQITELHYVYDDGKFNEVKTKPITTTQTKPETNASSIPQNELQDPGNLTLYRQFTNQIFKFKITGRVLGNDRIWGGSDGVYTDDSYLAKAAVHAGILKIGEEGIITVKILPGQSGYESSDKNGVSALSFGPWLGSYIFIKE